MSYARENLRNVALDHWNIGGCHTRRLAFRLVVNFSRQPGGNSHLWWAIAMALLAAVSPSVVFSFVRHDTDDEMHITSQDGLDLSQGLRFSMKTLLQCDAPMAIGLPSTMRAPTASRFFRVRCGAGCRSRESGMECFRRCTYAVLLRI